jgi:hypothetical protein
MTAPTYPASLDVSAGQPTGYQQFNRLRADALWFGASQNDAVPLGRFFGQYMAGIRLTLLGANRLRIQYDTRFPPTIMINGYMCQTDHNVDLPSNSFSGGSAFWYIFANRMTGSSEFTLSVNTSATEAPDQRLIGVCEWNGTALEETSIQTYQVWYSRLQNGHHHPARAYGLYRQQYLWRQFDLPSPARFFEVETRC